MVRSYSGHSFLVLLWTTEQTHESPLLDFGDLESTDGGRYIGSLLRLALCDLCFSHWRYPGFGGTKRGMQITERLQKKVRRQRCRVGTTLKMALLNFSPVLACLGADVTVFRDFLVRKFFRQSQRLRHIAGDHHGIVLSSPETNLDTPDVGVLGNFGFRSCVMDTLEATHKILFETPLGNGASRGRMVSQGYQPVD